VLTPDQARDIARRWAAEVATGGDPAETRSAQRAAPTVSELLDRYLSEHAGRKNKARTAADAERLVNKVIRPALGKLKVADVTANDVARLHGACAATPYQANRALAVLSKAFNLAELWGLRPKASNPCQDVERFAEEARERSLSAVEFAALGAALTQAERESFRLPPSQPGAPERLRRVSPQAIRAIRLLILTGARVSEILNLRWEHLNLEAGRAHLPDSKTGKKVIQLPAPALEVIAAAERPTSGRGFVIRGKDGRDSEVPLVNIKGPWAVICEAAGLKSLRLHDLRHAFASAAVNDGLSLPIIGALLGHRETRTTQRYAHLADDPQRLAAAQVAGRIAQAMLKS
jgi:integrase